jgi:serine/threonine protein kinase
MTAAPPSPPPRWDGCEYEGLLRSGGRADVLLYRRQRPPRRVAVAVLRDRILDDGARRRFIAETNLLVRISAHPSIVTIHRAEVTTEHLACIVMEHCPLPDYGARLRRERIPVAEALWVGVQIAGALETAHRAGILHGTIEPADILVAESGLPALSGFGISATTAGPLIPGLGHGPSLPWSPPEALADPPRADVRSDVFSLGATLYSLLGSRPPFGSATGSSSASELIARIISEPLAPLARRDVPEALNRTLSTAMAKDPGSRHDSALALGRALQQIEMDMSLPITQMDVLDEHGPEPGPAPDPDNPPEPSGVGGIESHTVVRRFPSVDPAVPAAAAPASLDPFAAVASPLTGERAASAQRPGHRTAAATVLRPAPAAAVSSSGTGAPTVPSRQRPGWPIAALAGALVLGLGVGTMALVRSTFAQPQKPTHTSASRTRDPEVGAVEPPQHVELTVLEKEHGTTPGTVRISWRTPRGMTEDDDVSVRWTGLPEGYDDVETEKLARGGTSLSAHVPQGWDEPCVVLTVVSKGGGVGPSSPQECVDVEELRSS